MNHDGACLATSPCEVHVAGRDGKERHREHRLLAQDAGIGLERTQVRMRYRGQRRKILVVTCNVRPVTEFE